MKAEVNMPGQVLHIESAEAVELAEQLAASLGKPVEEAVVQALRNEKQRVNPRDIDMVKVREILARLHAAPVVDPTPPDEMLYDEWGLPK